ncbi:MAG: hypothetical protein WAV40_00595 [Microgenomates group bacterium]
MPDSRMDEMQRDLAESLLVSMMKMDEGTMVSKSFSVGSAIENVGIEPLSDLYLEQWLDQADMRIKVLQHIRNYPNGFFVALLENVVTRWTVTKGYNQDKVRKDFMLGK